MDAPRKPVYTQEDYEFGNAGPDPQTTRYFKKIISSFFTGIFWMLLMSTLGFFFGFAIVDGAWRWYNFAFYILFAVSLAWLIRYYWKKWTS
jgi:membrane protein DedA with SNARE-associated domain